MEKMHLRSVLHSLPLPVFSFSSGKWRSYLALLINDFVTCKWKSLWNHSSSSSPDVTPRSLSSTKTRSLVGFYLQLTPPSKVERLKTLKLIHCSGDWDMLLKAVSDHVERLTEIHFEKLQVTDRGLNAILNYLDMEILHLVKTTNCTDVGLSSIAERCKFLWKLHIDGGKMNQIGDEGLVARANRCPNLRELVLIALNPTILSLGLIASNCKNLERLALCASETIGNAEISWIAAKCSALKKLSASRGAMCLIMGWNPLQPIKLIW
ncbi:F-box-like protein [Cinnamomum micranthum f. kanehirae]|uniref:F-box-like protein n=1 Tax=Cinnamomum micranthum f. kanehirae TaxID=337451 RepID=A0A3S3PBI8_9MAGN|nr:F-box-like protein [Cinnamomum micranthum f. kanehirae]